MIQIGDKIKNKRTNTTHIVDSIDVFDEIILIYTEDNKYIPIDDVEFVSVSIISKYFMKLFNDEKINTDLEIKCNNELKKLKLVETNSSKEKILRDLELFKSKF
jgi:hypothetical protein